MNRKTNGYAARIIAAALATALLALTGCTGDTERVKEEPTDLVWPLPPEQPRIKYVRSISTVEDIGGKETTSVTAALFGGNNPRKFRLKKPFSVNVDVDGRILVSDLGWQKVVVFDVAKKEIEIWGQDGKGVLSHPLGITSDSQGRVYVADGRQQRVVVYDRKGEFLFAAGKKGELDRPVGIVVNERLGRIYVADVKKHHIAVFDMQGSLVSTIGSRGTESGQFNFPTYLAIDGEDRLYVVDSMNFRIQVLDSEGTTLVQFGQHGDTPGHFARPKGVAVDSQGHVYVVDSNYGNIQIFDHDGGLLLYFGSIGSGPGQFYLPAGAYVDAQDQLYIADQFNQRIQVFQYLGEPSEQPAEGKAAAEP